MCNIPKDQFTELFERVHENCANNGISVIAIDIETNNMAGVFCCEDVATPLTKSTK